MSKRPPQDGTEEIIDARDITGVHHVYDYLPYTAGRVKRMLAEIGCYAENIYQGYKANRRPGYREFYCIRRISDNVIIHERIDLNGLRRFFASHDFPLQDEKSRTEKVQQNSEKNSL